MGYYFFSWAIGLIIWGVIWGKVTNMILRNKGYNDDWFWWGFFFGFIAALVAATKTNQEMIKAANANRPTTEANELREYKKLLDEGIITTKEFDDKKKKILGTSEVEKKPEIKDQNTETFSEEDYKKAQQKMDEDINDWIKNLGK